MMDKKAKNFIISLLRRGTYVWKPRTESLNKAKKAVGEFSTGRVKYQYECEICNKLFIRKDICMDHKNPVVPIEWVTDEDFDWSVYINNMFCQKEGWSVLCSLCHDKKTKTENQQRRELKNLAKQKVD